MKIATPKRARHTYTQRLVAAPDRVFPLLCPVREADWLDGWDPAFVASHSGVAERDCVFTTTAGATESVWCITQHEPGDGFVEMLKVTPGMTVCRLDIRVTAAPGGSQAEITYTHTSLGPEGDKFVDAFTAEAYRHFMQNWELRMNHYLEHGTVLRGADA